MIEHGFGGFELGKDLADRNSPAHRIAVDATTNFGARKIVNPQHGVTAETFAEASGLRQIAQSVNE